VDRRTVLRALASAPVVAACRSEPGRARVEPARPAVEDVVLATEPLGAQWKTPDPFLFCVHHDDAYPAGNARLGPAVSLEGRNIGSDFDGRDGWNMYHGDVVPGFPRHPHRGFETVTIVRRGLVDHADSLGAAARYGQGDVQWLTAGSGIVHAEMFPLLDPGSPNPLQLFQIWLNLPKSDKMVDPHFSMLWSNTIPRRAVLDEAGRTTELTVVAGSFGELAAPAPPPKSWASRSDSALAIWTLKMTPGARFTLPKAPAGTNRTLYFFRGNELKIGGRAVGERRAIELRADADARLENGPSESELLMLQGRPIAEPIARHGPFVMNSRDEIQRAYADYRRTEFGGWPWPSYGPVHGSEKARFARHADGRVERAS
jgi:redox-sensitive bicupin YhaK (pirin superfamily)